MPAPFGSLVAEDVVHEAPQSRERVRGRAAYVRFNTKGFPGGWRLAAERIGGRDREAVSLIQFSCNLHAVMSGGVAAAGDHLGTAQPPGEDVRQGFQRCHRPSTPGSPRSGGNGLAPWCGEEVLPGDGPRSWSRDLVPVSK